jgi:hypothetical protein
MKRSFGLTLLFILIYLPVIKAVEFTEKEKAVIYTNAVKVLENYQTVINQMGEFVVNDIEKAKSSKESFLELFVNRQVLLFNDLDPSHKLSEFYEAETYASNVILWYPDGLTIALDIGNARVSDIISHDESVYSLDIMVKKTMNGNYLNQTMNKNTEEITFRVAFGLENKSIGNFRIVGVRNAASNMVIDYSKALQEVNSEDFSAEDLAKIQSEVKNRIRDYANFLSLLGDPQEAADDKEFYKTSFVGLFSNTDTKLYNDITPEPQTNLIGVNDYLTAYIADYPNGIKNLSVNADSAKFGKVMKNEDGSYYTKADIVKFFSGSFKGKEVFRKDFPLIFKVSFNAAGKTFTDFKFNSVDISSQNFYEAAPGATAEKKPELVIKPVTRKGFGITIIGSFGQTTINSADINSMSLTQNSHEWTTSPLYGYQAGAGASYFFTDNISLRSGIELSTYSTSYTLSGTFTDAKISYDINSEPYNKRVIADYDSTVKVNYLTIPAVASYTSGKPGKIGFYGEAGVKLSIPLTATSSESGNYATSGVYSNPPSPRDSEEFSAFGFYTKENINESDDIEMKGMNLSAYGSIGVNLPLGYYQSLYIGPEIMIGISDIMKNINNYRDIFGYPYEHQPTKIKYFGLRLSFAYKL